MHHAVLLGVLLTLGCVPVPPVVPVLPPPSADNRPAPSPLTPVERLGRWDGSRFVDVRPRSVPPSHVHVIVHGWAPGWGPRVIEDRSLRAWEVPEFEPWIASLARSLEDADPHAVVLAYSWLDDAATARFILAQRHAWAHTDRQGRILAVALEQAVAVGFTEEFGRVHLVGHSYGARVATVAAIHLPKAPRHLTILDSPDSMMTYVTGGQSRLAELLGKLSIGPDTSLTFVDNYVSMVGARYGGGVRGGGIPGVVDVALTPPYPSFDYRHRHLYPTEFYAQTAHASFGIGWSPLVGRGSPPGGCFEQPYGELALNPGCADAP